MGLGLSITSEIVADYSGAITIDQARGVPIAQLPKKCTTTSQPRQAEVAWEPRSPRSNELPAMGGGGTQTAYDVTGLRFSRATESRILKEIKRGVRVYSCECSRDLRSDSASAQVSNTRVYAKIQRSEHACMHAYAYVGNCHICDICE